MRQRIDLRQRQLFAGMGWIFFVRMHDPPRSGSAQPIVSTLYSRRDWWARHLRVWKRSLFAQPAALSCHAVQPVAGRRGPRGRVCYDNCERSASSRLLRFSAFFRFSLMSEMSNMIPLRVTGTPSRESTLMKSRSQRVPPSFFTMRYSKT